MFESKLKRHGEVKAWYKNGQILEHSLYDNGKMHGEYKYWHKNGRLWSHMLFKNNKIIETYARN